MRSSTARRPEIGRHLGIGRVGERVEFPEPARAGPVELRMKGEALEAPFTAGRLHVHFIAWLVDIQVAAGRPCRRS